MVLILILITTTLSFAETTGDNGAYNEASTGNGGEVYSREGHLRPNVDGYPRAEYEGPQGNGVWADVYGRRAKRPRSLYSYSA